VDPDRLAELEEERRFLLRSLDDLEAEHEAGDVDDDDYETLRDGYISRAAAVLRAIEEGRATLPQKPPRRWGRVIVAVGVVVALAVASGWALAAGLGQRLPGQVMTGGLPEDSVSSLLSQARSLGFQDPAQAIDLYGRVLALDPDQVEALTYRSWLLALVSGGASAEVQQLALDQAVADLQRAVEIDPTYPDARCFLGIVTFRYLADPEAALVELRACQAANPPAEVRGLVDGVIASIEEALAGQP
jgi:tetratricopeptide (TPR) repeat protein